MLPLAAAAGHHSAFCKQMMLDCCCRLEDKPGVDTAVFVQQPQSPLGLPADFEPNAIGQKVLTDHSPTTDAETGFSVTIEKSPLDMGLGLSMDVSDGVKVHIIDVSTDDGAAARYNRKASEEHRIRPGYYVVGVNSSSGDAKKLLGDMQNADAVTLDIRKPVLWSVTIEKKDGETLGLDLHYELNSKSLVIDNVSEGAVARCNSGQTNPTMEIRRLDRIVAVNGFEGTSLELMDWLATPTVTLGMSRPARRGLSPAA